MKTYLEALWREPATCRKALLAIIGAVVQVIAMVYIHETWAPVVIAIATALGVYHVRNDTPKEKEVTP